MHDEELLGQQQTKSGRVRCECDAGHREAFEGCVVGGVEGDRQDPRLLTPREMTEDQVRDDITEVSRAVLAQCQRI